MRKRPRRPEQKALRRPSTGHKRVVHTVCNTNGATEAGSTPRTPTGYTSTRTELCRAWRMQGGKYLAGNERSESTARLRAQAAQVPKPMGAGPEGAAGR